MTGAEATRKIDALCRKGWTRNQIADAICVSVYAMDKWKSGTQPREPVMRMLRGLKAKPAPAVEVNK